MRKFARIMFGAVLALAVSTPGSADPKSPKLAKCDGKVRRPANPYGSILPSVDPAAGTMTPPASGQGGIDVFPSPAPPKPSGSPPTAPAGGTSPTPVPPIGAIDPSPQFRSC